MEEISIVKLGSPQASHVAWEMPSDEGGIVTSSKVLICFEFLKQTMIFLKFEDENLTKND